MMAVYCEHCGSRLALTQESATEDRDYINTHDCPQLDDSQPFEGYGDGDDNSGHSGGVLATDGGNTVDPQSAHDTHSRRQAQKYQSLIDRYPDAGWNEELLDKYADDVEADSNE